MSKDVLINYISGESLNLIPDFLIFKSKMHLVVICQKQKENENIWGSDKFLCKEEKFKEKSM